ncbi:hypothetical protein NQ176_g6797 [Zarea fungicola]|uniref:Uncharacterized protein n=1 Tax=Zarea fungicola TaxID=93591 RepID=A0ACC1N1F9_9HYPO|nr:hypothetical protein NQ176_g6797 [Lecanicillium fungicola]
MADVFNTAVHHLLSDAADKDEAKESSFYSLSASQNVPVSISDKWFYPEEIANDLKDIPLAESVKHETLNSAWEYTRCAVPFYTNQERYIALVRLNVIAVIVEFQGDLVDISSGDDICGYSVSKLLDTLFEDGSTNVAMGREYRTFLLFAAEKSSERRHSVLFNRYINSMARSAEDWQRIRDADGLVRFTIMAALACNNLDSINYTDGQLAILSELAVCMYDAVAYYKHRAEGESHNTFAYGGNDLRIETFRKYREILWALDTSWQYQPEGIVVANTIRCIGGPIHMTMRRYRFVEDGLQVCKPETIEIVNQACDNVKLWNRIGTMERPIIGLDRYHDVIAREKTLLIKGLAGILESERHCNDCVFRQTYDNKVTGEFSGITLCSKCRSAWEEYIGSIAIRTAAVFPEITSVLENSCNTST